MAELDAKFNNFDDLVTAYYTGTFEQSSQLSNEQRMSRKRRLPGVISDLVRSAEQWSTQERCGFDDELLKATEAMLISENNKANDAMQSGITELLDAVDNGTELPIAETLSKLRSTISNDVSFHFLIGFQSRDQHMLTQDIAPPSLCIDDGHGNFWEAYMAKRLLQHRTCNDYSAPVCRSDKQ